ncbi:hypothetical protein CSB93_0849 [Pseudomonas paraeruginosa]|uniref:Uncharacterized protein n=1 Tax=Pseudomonas paraeruginosa TaxID=2994495 RepID=A0A2R3IUV3_9PSED|nr:hypothetical protein CSB93_0849 [Pseudomonas paraeruginosa]
MQVHWKTAPSCHDRAKVANAAADQSGITRPTIETLNRMCLSARVKAGYDGRHFSRFNSRPTTERFHERTYRQRY